MTVDELVSNLYGNKVKVRVYDQNQTLLGDYSPNNVPAELQYSVVQEWAPFMSEWIYVIVEKPDEDLKEALNIILEA